jgi:hypothetical protein
MTIMIPPAAHVTSHGRIRVSPGSVSPTAASTSATPRKSWNHRGSNSFISLAISGGGKRKSQPWARNAAASTTCATQSAMFMTVPSLLHRHDERGTVGSTSHGFARALSGARQMQRWPRRGGGRNERAASRRPPWRSSGTGPERFWLAFGCLGLGLLVLFRHARLELVDLLLGLGLQLLDLFGALLDVLVTLLLDDRDLLGGQLLGLLAFLGELLGVLGQLLLELRDLLLVPRLGFFGPLLRLFGVLLLERCCSRCFLSCHD